MIASTANLNPYNDNELIALLNAGDESGFNFIYYKYRQRVHRIAMRYLKSEANSNEVVQDVFMQLWLERNKINASTPIEGWLCTVTKNITINRLKKMATEYRVINQLKATQPSFDDATRDKINDADCSHLLGQALKNLSQNQQTVFILAREKDQSYSQIANQLNISPLTVKTHMSRALSSLKVFFTGYLF